MSRILFLLACTVLALFGAVGCSRQEPIAVYTVDKPFVVERLTSRSEAGPARTLAAIVLRGGKGWFFKLTGPEALVSRQQAAFDLVVKSIRFSALGDPQWNVPAGWRQTPGNEMRFATLVWSDAKDRLELAVSALPRTSDDSDTEYLLANINRWRKQLQLPALNGEELATNSGRVDLANDLQAVTVDLVGQPTNDSSRGMELPAASRGAGPDLNRLPNDHPPVAGQPPADKAANKAAAPADLPLSFTTPEGWQTGAAKPMRVQSFVVQDGERALDIYISRLGAAGSDVVANINRWRGQVKLPELSADELRAQTSQLQLGAHTATYVELVTPEDQSPRQAIYGAIVVVGDTGWFFKLVGDATLAEGERSRFRQWVESVKFK